MADPQLINYIKDSLANNIPLEQIKQNLLGAGWNPQQVDEAINYVSPQQKPKSKFPVLIVAGIILVIFIGAGIFFFLNSSNISQNNPSSNTPSVTQGSETPSTTTTVNETSQSTGLNMQLISCGTDIDCFINQSNSCNPSSLTYTYSVNLLGFIENETAYYELRGLSSGNCIIYNKILNIYGAYDAAARQSFLNQNMTDDQINQKQQEINSVLAQNIGEDGTCYYPLNILIQNIEGLKTGNFNGSTEDIQTYNCTGSLYSINSTSANVTVTGNSSNVNSSVVITSSGQNGTLAT